MKQRKLKLRTRQRQKISRRTILIVSASCFVLMILGVTLFFNFSNVENTRAKDGNTIHVLIAPEFQPVNEKEIAQPFFNPELSTNPNTIYIRKAKPIVANSHSIQH